MKIVIEAGRLKFIIVIGKLLREMNFVVEIQKLIAQVYWD